MGFVEDRTLSKRRMTRRLILIGSAVAMVGTPIWMAAQQQPSNSPATVPAVAPVATPAPASQPVVSSSEVFAPPTTAPVAMRKAKPATTQISVRFKDAPIDAVLQYLSQVAGYEVVKEVGIDRRVTVWSDQPISPEEAVSLLNTLLLPDGYTAEVQGRVLKITTREKAKKGSIPVRVGADPDEILLNDDLITQVIPLKSVDAVKLKTDLEPLVGTDADLTANAASNSLMITDTSANIHRVVMIVASLDKTQAMESDIIVQQLKYADATSTAKLIMDIFQPTTTSTQGNQQGGGFPFFGRGGFGGFGGGGGGGGGGGRGNGGGGGGSTENQDKGRTGTVTASADTRTNTIVITGPKETLAEIKIEILDKIDNDPSANQKFFTYHVKNGQAVDMQATLMSLFSGTGSTSTSTNTRSTSSSSRLNSSNGIGLGSSGASSSGFGSSGGSNRGSSGGGGGNNSNNNSGSNRGNNNGGGGGFGGGGSSGSTSGTPSLLADLVGQVEVVADADTNSLLVLTATKYEEPVKDIITELDRPVPQVLIKCLIAEVTHDRSDDLGLDFSILNLSKGLTVGSNNGNASAETSAGVITNNTGGLAVNLVKGGITSTLHALAVTGKMDVLSRPYILTSDNQEANILVGQNVPFISNTRTDSTGNIINTVQYQDVGIILDVTPHINTDGLVVMDVNPEISDISSQTIQIQGGPNPVNQPIFDSRSASTHVGVRDGDTIVIGGLMQDKKTQTINKVPLLGDIPWIGLLFQRDQVLKEKTELLIFLTPHVAQSPDNLQPISNSEMKGVRLTPGAVQPGTFQEHVDGMRLGGSATQPVLPVPKAAKDRDAWEPEPKMP
jgi:general secretion pathway protein D